MSNRLGRETSPYLLQHADNPVDWYPWGDTAFEHARETGKPVLLSIGYSACHWCHVMAHESFEDPATAELMNHLFVNIKVDREERPDVDRIYQTAQQLLTRRGGGWPLTMFLDAEDRRPFFGGTYFPNTARHGLPAFRELLTGVAQFYAEQRDEVRAQGERLVEVFGRLTPAAASPDATLGPEPLATLRTRLGRSFDREFGGFGAAPKFPHAETIAWLLRAGVPNDAEPDTEAMHMATLTLTRMAEGGIFDHVGGGFCRYSVDGQWQIPHFEKMLYDNGALLAAYAQAFQATGETGFAQAAQLTADWMLSDMRSADGGFFAARDADSEGEEGKYYVWTPDDVARLLEADDYDVFARRFGLDAPPNFEGRWHLTVRASIGDIAKTSGRTADAVRASLANGRERLSEARASRVAPGLDDKQLTAWNALTIRGLAIAGRVLDRGDLVDAAARAADFMRKKLFVDGRLRASYKDGTARFGAYLDDHAYLVDALLELSQARWREEDLRFATRLADLVLEHFEDAGDGGFFFTADDHETLMHRPKPLADEAMPSGNGVAAFALQRLGHLLGETRYLAAAEGALRCAWPALQEFPQAHVSLLTALGEYLTPPEIVVIRGVADEIGAWRDAALRPFAPARLVFAIPDDAEPPGLLAERAAVPGKTLAYRCVGTHCELPVESLDELLAALDRG
jgi:uncharacterized protein YyaL (SSP411 family)